MDYALSLPGSVTQTSLTLPQELDFDGWQTVGRDLQKSERSLMWWIGDWWAFGERKYGERAAAVVDGHTYQTMKDAGWVSRQFERSRRRDLLSWSHHREVAAMPEDIADRLLDLAVANDWTRNDLRRAVKQTKMLANQAEAVASSETFGKVAHCGWQEFLPTLMKGSVDLLITDPPYSTDVPNIEGFAAAWVPEALSVLKNSGRAYIWTGAYPAELQAYLRVLGDWCYESEWTMPNVLVWTYRNTLGPSPTHAYKTNWQACFYLYGPDAGPLDCPLMVEQFSVIDIAAPDGRHEDGRLHAWQKPDELAERLIGHASKPGDVVLDCFAGTGTFLSAAVRLGRTAIGCDSSEDMVDLCVRRGLGRE